MDRAEASVPIELPRAVGRVELTVAMRDGRSRIAGLVQAGPSRLRFPTPLDPAVLEAVLLNNAGGLTDGDHIAQLVRVGPAARATLATASAEKVYRARTTEPARVTTRLEVADGGRLEWLPQEAILFDRSRLVRTLEAHLAPTAGLLLVESLVLGRGAMGEIVAEGLIEDRLRIYRSGRLARADAFRLDGPIDALRRRPALLGGALATALVLQVGRQVPDLLERLRERLADVPVRAGASGRGDVLACRILAADGRSLRRALKVALGVLRAGPDGCETALPRVWGA